MESNVKFLRESLLYRMSLGSKELYHSNVWAWLIENDPDFVKVFFPAFDEKIYEVTDVSRECRNRDVIIWVHKRGFDKKAEKYFYVIENKIKSLQSKDQLERYSENLWDNTMLGGVVTGIRNALDNHELSLPNKSDNRLYVEWTFVSYESISKEILRIAQAGKSPVIKKRLAQITEYCQMIESINKLIGEAIEKHNNHINYDCDKILSELRLKDVYTKLKGSDFFRYVNRFRAELERLVPKEKGFQLEMEQSFHNGKATLDFRFTNLQENYGDYLTIGVQVEGSQYRLLAQKNGKHCGRELYEEFKGIWFDETFDKSVRERTLFGKSTSMKKQFDSYGEGSGKYVMVYQYYNLNPMINAYEQVFGAIKSDLEKARDIILKTVE